MDATMINGVIACTCGCYLILIAQLLNTSNFKSALIFKFIPVMLGIASILSGLKVMGAI